MQYFYFCSKLIKAPFLFLAVGSQTYEGSAASARVVAATFYPLLGTVGVLLSVFSYALETYGAILCAELMKIAAAG